MFFILYPSSIGLVSIVSGSHLARKIKGTIVNLLRPLESQNRLFQISYSAQILLRYFLLFTKLNKLIALLYTIFYTYSKLLIFVFLVNLKHEVAAFIYDVLFCQN